MIFLGKKKMSANMLKFAKHLNEFAKEEMKKPYMEET